MRLFEAGGHQFFFLKKHKTHAVARTLLNKEWRLCQKGRPVNIAIKAHFRSMLFRSPTWAKFLHLLSLFWTRDLSTLSKVFKVRQRGFSGKCVYVSLHNVSYPSVR